MSAPSIAADVDLVVGGVGRHEACFRAAHRDANTTPITTTVLLRVPMSHEDVEALFWRMLRDEGVSFADLADDTNACWFLLDAVVGHGVSTIDSYRDALAAVSPGDPDHEAVTQLRERVEQLLGPHPRRRGRTSRQVRAGRRGKQATALVSHTPHLLDGPPPVLTAHTVGTAARFTATATRCRGSGS
jgi:hypothetical protein